MAGRVLASLLLVAATGACQNSRPSRSASSGDAAPERTKAAPEALVADSAAAARRGFVTGFSAFSEQADAARAVVEIPAGASAKWMVGEGERLVWERRGSGERRVVDYLAYPVNYGIVPGTAAGDGDPLDVLVLGPALERGSVWAVRPVGVLRLSDDGAPDDKILTVRSGGGPFSDVRDLDALRRRYPGVTSILWTWFTRYKGPAGDLQAHGYGSAAEARRLIREAARAFGK